jgi:hypothetical protein
MAKITQEPDFIAIVERSYYVDPQKTHNELLHLGMPELATHLKVDHMTGRLRQRVEAVRGLPL